jgi:branched-chain amino acid transport system ATP-binding protein
MGAALELGDDGVSAVLSPATAPMLALDGIDAYYGETQALFDVSLQVAPGEVLALLGPNGAGKTTTLRAILGLTPARRGYITFDGRDITRKATHEIARLGIGWVPDDRRVFPTLTVARNLAIAAKRTRFRAWSERECFEIFSALEVLRSRECENLSGGEMQMVAIARALLGSPGLVLLDEPSQGLAPKVVHDVMAIVRRLGSEGVSVLLVEQNVACALEVADRVCVMQLGRIVHEAPAAALRDDAVERRRWLGL